MKVFFVVFKNLGFKFTVQNILIFNFKKNIKQNLGFDITLNKIQTHLDKCFFLEVDLDLLREASHISVLAVDDEDLKDVVRDDVEDDEKNGL